MTAWEPPDWLRRALAEREVGPVPAPDDAVAPLKIATREIRAARPMDGESGARLVLILDVGEGHDWANTMLLTNVVEAATSKDVRLDPDETGLAFPVLVETDIVGPMFVAQLGPRLGQIDSEILAQLQIVQRGDDAGVLADRRGLPVRSRRESRARLKERELQAMHDLAAECFTELMLKEQTQPPVLVDDALFEFEDSEASDAVRLLLQLIELGQLEIPAEALLTVEGELPSWLEEMNPEQVAALERLWREALRSTPAPRSASPLETEWQPRRLEETSTLERYISARVDRGERSIRLATRARHWVAAHPSNLKDGVIKLKLGNRGIVQISPELVEEAA